MSTFAGHWITSFGPMDLRDDHGTITGTYSYRGMPYPIEGTLDNDRFVFRYEDSTGPGEGWFALVGDGQFRGQFRLDGVEQWQAWQGHREWDGIWDTSFGLMRLIQHADRIEGHYDGVTAGTIDGRLDGGRFVFRYQESNVNGEGSFELAEDALSFTGVWHPTGVSLEGTWNGRRVLPTSGATWLVVIEAQWQHSLADRDYSYGSMLREIFARLPNVAVRHRFFNDEISLARWCREVVYFPESTIVMIASHGNPQGIAVHGKTINTKLVIDHLRHAPGVQLLHFSACLVMKEDNAGDFVKRIKKNVPFPISGYTTAVDWGGSAIVEFAYLDMMLSKHCSPEDAAALLPQLVAYAGDEPPAGCPYAGAGFRFLKGGS